MLGDDWGAQPGMFSDSMKSRGDSIGETYLNRVKSDMERLGWSIQRYDENNDLSGGYLIAIALDLDPEMMDYHFYRQNNDGTWSCKWGDKEVETGIENPQVSAYKHGYIHFLGYYYKGV